jgi:hypothetical protein
MDLAWARGSKHCGQAQSRFSISTQRTMLPTDCIDHIKLTRVARIKTPPGAIFYTLRTTENGLFDAFYRLQYNQQMLGRCKIDPTDWSIVQDMGKTCIGEDPRCLSHRGIDYVIDNSWGNSSLIVPADDFRRCKLPSKGKNLSLIAHGDQLLCIDWLFPLTVLSSTESPYPESWTTLKRKRSPVDYELRGGTPGYKTSVDNVYVGFGHRTTTTSASVRHTPFVWRLDVDNWQVTFAEVDIHLERAITDPTCIIRHNGKFYLVTAESHLPWFGVQEFFTCIYELQFSENTRL